jgi:hypothetical protein
MNLTQAGRGTPQQGLNLGLEKLFDLEGCCQPPNLLYMKIRRLLFYCMLPLAVALALIGFPLPIAPNSVTKAGQEQSAPADKRL